MTEVNESFNFIPFSTNKHARNIPQKKLIENKGLQIPAEASVKKADNGIFA